MSVTDSHIFQFRLHSQISITNDGSRLLADSKSIFQMTSSIPRPLKYGTTPDVQLGFVSDFVKIVFP